MVLKMQQIKQYVVFVMPFIGNIMIYSLQPAEENRSDQNGKIQF
jgi:hypothetical protein